MSSAELSLDISQVVKRLLGGESVDVLRSGEDLARKHPDLGMPGELIAKAIARTASMMGVVLEEWGSAAPAPPADTSASSEQRGQCASPYSANQAAEAFASDIADVMDLPVPAGKPTTRDPVGTQPQPSFGR